MNLQGLLDRCRALFPSVAPTIALICLLCIGPLCLTECVSDSIVYDKPVPRIDASPDSPQPKDPTNLGPVGTDDAFDIMTWNLRRFPCAGDATVNELAEIIPKLKPDMIAVQEIADADSLERLANMLPGWKSDVATFFDPSGSYNPPVGMLWDSSTVSVARRYLLFEDDYQAFPRSPLVFEIKWKDDTFVVINIHNKALGDDYIDWSNEYDEEMRRVRASQRLDVYLQENLQEKQVIVLGDFNDQLEEPRETNVFLAFLDRADAYLFTDMHIAQNPTSDTVSYPIDPYVSHIDHIMITKPLIDRFNTTDSFTRTVATDLIFFDSLSAYQNLISDHRPLLMHLRRSQAPAP